MTDVGVARILQEDPGLSRKETGVMRHHASYEHLASHQYVCEKDHARSRHVDRLGKRTMESRLILTAHVGSMVVDL